MAPFHMMGYCQNLLFPAALNRASEILISQRFVSRSVLKKLNLPEPPKRPGSAYNKFIQIQSPILKKKYPDVKQSEIMKLAGTLWKTVDESLKLKLKEQSDNEFVAYRQALASYKEAILPHEENINKQEEIEARKKNRKELKSLGKPKRPLSAYMRFAASQQQFRGDVKVTEYMKLVAEKWKNLPASEKAALKLEYDREKIKYDKELEHWQAQINFAVLQKVFEKPKKSGGKKKAKNEGEEKENQEEQKENKPKENKQKQK